MAMRTEKTNGMLRIGDDRDIAVMNFELEKEDIMKFKPLYEAMHMFLMEEGYSHPLTNDDKVEDLYWERWTPSGAKEQHIWWRVKKDINPYIRYFVAINFQTLNITKAETAWKNKKINAEKIDCIVRVSCVLQWDMKNKFQKSIAWRFRKAFFNRVYQEEIEARKNDLNNFGMKFQRLIKQYFEMTSEGEYPKIHQDPMGYKG
ncbi:TPA: hypothetical protein HA251_02970 [Candidatus Woesearchaeota archaeon]|nr:hypothetical protein [Candidatus Woesearchaeota archaeon]